MMTHNAIRMELATRLRRENYFHGGVMPRETALAWKGYLAGCLEWSRITGADYWYLVGFLPLLEEGPVEDIACGRDELPDEAELQRREPQNIPQAIMTEEKFGNDTLTHCGRVPITKPKYINGRLE